MVYHPCRGCAGVFQLPSENLSANEFCKHCEIDAQIEMDIYDAIELEREMSRI